MRRWTACVALTAIALAAGCAGSGGDDATPPAPATTTTTTTTPPPSIDMTVRVTANKSGWSGCYTSTKASGLDIGNDSRVTVTDEAGRPLSVATMQLSPGLTPGVDTCDWTVEFGPVSGAADFYRVYAGGELVTVSGDELRDLEGSVTVNIGVNGTVDWAPT